MASQKSKHAIGIFFNRRSAEQALIELKNMGFPMHKVSIITKTSNDRSLDNQSVPQLSMTRAEGAKVGAIAGSIGVGSLTLVVGLSMLLVPGVGPVLAVESILTTFLGGGIGAAIGGLYGALQGWLVPEEQARIYNDRFNQGDYLILMEAMEDEIWSAEAVFSRQGIRSWRIYDALYNKSDK